MNFETPSLRSLEAFHAVVTLGSVDAAAKQLFITQPAISHLLRSLDKTTGLTLFQKSGRRLSLSEDGTAYFDEVVTGIQVLNELRNAAERVRSAKTGHVRIAAIPVYADNFMPELLAGFSNANPSVKVTLEVAEQYRSLIMLETGVVDLALVVENHSDAFDVHLAISSQAMMIIPKSWGKPATEPIQIKELREKPFVSLPKGSPFRTILNQYFSEHGIELIAKIETRTQSAVAALVSGGAGFAIIDKIGAGNLDEKTMCFPLEPPLKWQFQLLSRKNSRLSTAANMWLDWVKQSQI